MGMLGDGCELSGERLQLVLDARATQSVGIVLFKNSLFSDQINSEMSKKMPIII